MSDTPSTEQIRDWCEGYGPDWGVFTEENVQQGLAFDRWLADHDRQVRAEALREVFGVRPTGFVGDEEECRITPDGWCATHSTSAGPVRCDQGGNDE